MSDTRHQQVLERDRSSGELDTRPDVCVLSKGSLPEATVSTVNFHPAELPLGPSRVVGIGASAGGVEAFTRLLKALPPDSGMAFVLLSHLSPTHSSELSRIFSTVTRMLVQDAVNGKAVEPNRVYVLPPDKILTIVEGRLRLVDRGDGEGRPTAIDQFLESLAADLGPRAVGVILSGTGSDGTIGLRAIKAHGGATYAEDPALAAYEGMPRSAVLSGAVDFALPLDGIALALTLLARSSQPSAGSAEMPLAASVAVDSDDETMPEISPAETEALDAIIKVLQNVTGVDFHHYKPPSLTRRIRRRAEELGFPQLTAYLLRLRQDPAEVTALFHTVLIHVTRFFREPEMFEAVKATVIPSLLAGHSGNVPLRIWVIGCSTGEEVYSLAISVLEVEAALGLDVPFRIFASDVSEPALAASRLGHYSEASTQGISAERLAQYFGPIEHGYRVNKRVREMCVFARHDITRDPPFAQLDLVLCCNVLIYLDPVLQRRLLQNMHYALKPNGYLVLGPAETTGGAEGLFSFVDRNHKIYQRRAGPSRPHVAYGKPGSKYPSVVNDAVAPTVPIQWSTAELQRAAERVFFTEYPSASVIVNQEFDVLRFQGSTGPYLAAPSGAPTVQLLRLAHPDLRLVLGRMLRRVKKDRTSARRLGIRIGTGKQAQQVNVSVLPVTLDDPGEQYFLVVFEAAPHPAGGGPAGTGTGRGTARVAELEAELAENQEYLQAVIDQQDATHTELQAAYEASLSVNEEYQSTNEELESAKEEMQSLNEELTTVNEQLQQRNAELGARTAEVSSLLESMDMPILLLTRELRLRAFNSRAAGDLHLTPGLIGHSISEGNLPLPLADLREVSECAFREEEVQEREFQDGIGRWRALRVWPVHPGGESGTVAVALIDITKLKADVVQERAGRTYSEAIVETVLEPLVVLAGDFCMLHANQAFHRTFRTDPESITRKKVWELGDGEWATAELREFLSRTYQSDRPAEGPELILDSSRLGRRIFRSSAGRIRQSDVPSNRLLLALEDITARRLAESAIMEAARMQAVGQLAGGVAHEINNQMTAVLGFAGFLLSEMGDTDPRQDDVVQIMKAAQRSAEITQQLLAFSRRQVLQPEVFELNPLVAGMEPLLRRTLGPNVTLQVVLGEPVGQVRADRAQVEQVLVNLGLNARDAMGGNGRLTIQTTTVEVTEQVSTTPDTPSVTGGTYARLIVRDTGAGMDTATIAHIFEPFFTTKSIGEGTGLGLASVFGVVKQSGGLIQVESTPGEGTTFTIDLPQVVVDLPVVQVAEPAVMTRGTETILVVDDEDVVRTWVSRCLRGLGYRVVEASEAGEALRLIAEEERPIELVVSDMVMPGMDGGQLRNRLVELRPGLPVLIMSGFAREELVRQGRLDAQAFLLPKPFGPEALASKVRELLDGRKQAKLPR